MSEETNAAQAIRPTGEKWGDPIDEARKQALWARLRAWWEEIVHDERNGPFAGEHLTGAEVFWLAVLTLTRTMKITENDAKWRLHWAQNQELQAVMHFKHEFVPDLLPGILQNNSPELASDLMRNFGPNVVGDLTSDVTREFALDLPPHFLPDLSLLPLNGADLYRDQLQGAMLYRAQMQNAILIGAQFQKADLREAHLEGTNLRQAHLEGAKLQGAFLSEGTSLYDATFSTPTIGSIQVADVRWNGANLATLKPSLLPPLGDEQAARSWMSITNNSFVYQLGLTPGEQEMRWAGLRVWRLKLYQSAVRANRQVAVTLQNQGMNEQAGEFAYHAQLMQRKVYLLEGALGRWLFSWFLWLIAGYGYRPLRSVFIYLGSIALFAAGYFAATHGLLTFGLAPSRVQPLQWYEALVLSVSAFHGRGFFQPVQSLGDPVAILAALEAVFGLLIEISFIATFTQRFFGSK